MAEERNERRTESEHTTIIHTDSGGRGGGGAGAVLAVVLVIVLVGVLLLFAFGDWLGGAAEEIDVPEQVDVNVDIDGSDMQLPEVEVPEARPPAENQNSNSS